jgi:alpha-tubulin suppressor-like RCC1 family protein
MTVFLITMNTPVKLFRKTLSTIAAVSIAVLICACVKQPQDMVRDNPFDTGGSNWHPPVVTAMMDTAVKPNDTITITATGTDNGTIVSYIWAKNGTTYSDTMDSGSLQVAWPDSDRKVVRVKVIDNDGVASAPDSCVVTVTLDFPVPNAGQDTTVSLNDTVQLHGSATDRLGFITSWAWDIGNTGTFIITTTGDTAFIAPASENLNYQCVLRVTDDDGNISMDTVRILVLQDVPVSNAGHDTMVSINDTVLLHGSATQQFGSIVKWEWKIGLGNWATTSGPDTMVIMPDTEQTCICSLAVTDDDGNRGVDEIKIVAFVKVKDMSAGYYHSLILKSNSKLWACGNNDYGQLGDGSTTPRYTPVQVMSGVQSKSAGGYHSLILKSDGTLWACGNNDYGQLGDGSTTPRYTPVQVMSNVQQVSAGGSHSLILKIDGTLWVCGNNTYGQLGDGTTTNRYTPVPVMSSVQSVVTGYYHSLILKSDGTLWACGSNAYGQLGDGTTTNRYTPVPVMSSVQRMAAKRYYSFILKNDNTLWACGYNYWGQLGDGTSIYRYTPVQVMSSVQSMSTGYFHSLILKSDGTLWACGYNGYGQLGNGATSDHWTPVQVMSNVLCDDAGGYHSLIVKSDSTLWACGNNNSGQLGDGTTINRYAPVRIIPPQ